MKQLGVIILTLSTLALARGEGVDEKNPPEFLQNLQGCFKVTYRYVESAKYNFTIGDALEWITLKDDSGTYSLQHYGILDDQQSGKKELMKHWREDWKVEGDNVEQKVLSPYGKLRYECKGKLVFNQVRCQSAGAPKPNRDDGRKDYDVLDRDTTLQFTSKGWVQSEINGKKTTKGVLVATEVGWNDYVRVDKKACAEVGELP